MCVRWILCAGALLFYLGTMGQSGLSGSLLYGDAFSDKPGSWGGAAYPAVLADARSGSLAMSGEQRFGTDIRTMEFMASIPLKGNGIGLVLSNQGTSYLSWTDAGFAWSKRLGKQVLMGARLGFSSIAAVGYGSSFSPTAGLGLGLQINEQCRWLIQADNISSLFMSNEGQGFVVRSGLGYIFSPVCFASFEVISRQQGRTSFAAAVHYDPVNNIRMRLGYGTDIFLLSASFNYHGFVISVNSGWHLALGINSGIGISYEFKPGLK